MSEKRIALVINISCKNYEAHKQDLESFSKLISCSVFEVQGQNIASTISQLKDYKIIVIAGGDGSIHTAVQNISDKQVLGVFPSGTLNHFAKDAKLPLSYQELAENINQNKTKSVDVIAVNGEKIINNLSLGFYPGFVKKRELLENKVGKIIAYLPAFIQQFLGHKNEQISLEYDNNKSNINFHSLLISNNCYSTEFPSLFQRDNLEQGKIGIYCLKDSSDKSSETLWQIDSTHETLVIKSKKKYIAAAIDGETKRLKTPLEITLLPQHLKVIC